ncbi:MAG: hypothetical protein PHT50_06520 [Candidatus Omnitrophica bacterium]|nr:hypothetical protein [Candidatus Omnitrophota bacterium]
MPKKLFLWTLVTALCFVTTVAFSQSNKLTEEQIIQIASAKQES